MCPQQRIHTFSSKDLPVMRRLKYPQSEGLLAHTSTLGRGDTGHRCCLKAHFLEESTWDRLHCWEGAEGHTGERNTHRRDPLDGSVDPAAFLCCRTSLGCYSWIISPGLNPQFHLDSFKDKLLGFF